MWTLDFLGFVGDGLYFTLTANGSLKKIQKMSATTEADEGNSKPEPSPKNSLT
jgi:hypothetical protein